MKKLLLTITVLSLLVLVGCKSDPAAKLLGTWQLESVEGEELTDAEKAMTITFEKESKFKQEAGERKRAGKFAVSKDGKTVTLTPEGGEAEDMTDVEMKGNTISFKDKGKGSKITMKKK